MGNVGTDVGAARITSNPRELLIARYAADVLEHAGYFKDGFSIQTGSGASATAVTRFMEDRMRKAGIRPTVAVADRQVLAEVAPGERIVLSPDEARALAQPAASAAQRARSGSSRPRGSAQSSRKRARG